MDVSHRTVALEIADASGLTDLAAMVGEGPLRSLDL